MRRILMAAFVAGMGIGCASSTEIRQGAYEHLAKSQALEAQGAYYSAAKERAAADKQFAKARQRAYEEASATRYYY
ncbi:MAG TPA: hypothetical protein VF997_01790 [Polyangia bacterium]